jgi:hypothetical protein
LITFAWWGLFYKHGNTVMRNHKNMRMLLAFFLALLCSETSWAKDVELVALGVRGGMNFQHAGLPPGEKEDFEQFDVFAIMGLPWEWESPSSWELRWQLRGSAGIPVLSRPSRLVWR